MSISVPKFLENLESDTLQHEVDPLDEGPVEMVSRFIEQHHLSRTYRKANHALLGDYIYLIPSVENTNTGKRNVLGYSFDSIDFFLQDYVTYKLSSNQVFT
jgi:hypothetical protein